jgi:hypothetical protein
MFVKCKIASRKDFLTLDKMYAVLAESMYAYLILSDYDCEVWIDKDWFDDPTAGNSNVSPRAL